MKLRGGLEEFDGELSGELDVRNSTESSMWRIRYEELDGELDGVLNEIGESSETYGSSRADIRTDRAAL